MIRKCSGFFRQFAAFFRSWYKPLTEGEVTGMTVNRATAGGRDGDPVF